MNVASFVAVAVAVFNALKGFLGPTAGSVAGYLNVAELARVVLTAIVAGVGTGVGFTPLLNAVLTAVQSDASAIFPGDTALAAGLLALVVDLFRRFGHGATPAPTPTPSPAK